VEGQVQLSGQLYGQGQQLLHALIKGLTGTSGLQRIHKTASILCHLMECIMTGERTSHTLFALQAKPLLPVPSFL